MNINEIAKTMTRDEFIHNIIYDNEDGECYFEYKNERIDCPSYIDGLDSYFTECKYGDILCKECWLNSIKNIKFKNEIDNNKKYKASEIITMIENNELNNDDIIIDKGGEEHYIEDIKQDDISINYLLEYSPFTIKEQKSVDFTEVIKMDGKVKVEHKLLNSLKEYKKYKDFQNLDDLFYMLGEDFKDYEIRDILTNGKWFIQN